MIRRTLLGNVGRLIGIRFIGHATRKKSCGANENTVKVSREKCIEWIVNVVRLFLASLTNPRHSGNTVAVHPERSKISRNETSSAGPFDRGFIYREAWATIRFSRQFRLIPGLPELLGNGVRPPRTADVAFYRFKPATTDRAFTANFTFICARTRRYPDSGPATRHRIVILERPKTMLCPPSKLGALSGS